MSTDNFFSRLNGRLIIVYILAAWFFSYAFMQWGYLYNTEYIDLYRQHGDDTLNVLIQKENSAISISYFNLVIQIAPLLGKLVALTISLILAIKRHWFWFNAVLAFIILHILGWYNLTGWSIAGKVFTAPGKLFHDTFIEFLVNGLLLLLIGLWLLFSKTSKRFIIQKRKPKLSNVNANIN